MKRRFGLMVVAAAVLAAGPELDACGDKSLSAGGIRMQRALAARYPASVLAYVPVQLTGFNGDTRAEAAGDAAHRRAPLSRGRQPERAPHIDRDRTVQHRRRRSRARSLTSSGTWVRHQPVSSLVPVAYKLTKAETREAQKQRRFLINAPGRAVQYLTTIAEAVRFGSASSRKG